MPKKPNFELLEDDAFVEKALRRSAPDLPDALRSRTLRQCQVHAEGHRKRKQRLNRQLIGAIGCVLVLQSLTLSLVDAQNTQILSGNSQPPLFASLSISELSKIWEQRSRQIAQLMNKPEIG